MQPWMLSTDWNPTWTRFCTVWDKPPTGAGPSSAPPGWRHSSALGAIAATLLTVVFRSLLVPLTATAGFLLVSFMPVFLIGVVFGLAMDYQVFLVSRIREAHVHGATARQAIVEGFTNSARVVTAAALIMIAVFAAFMLSEEPDLKSMGFALVAAVFFDAFLIRMTLMPALLHLGERAWWLPRWLEAVIRTVDIEGESLSRTTEVPAEPHPTAPIPGRHPHQAVAMEDLDKLTSTRCRSPR
jgi:hypothetical protein